MVRPFLIDIKSVELKHYPFMISLNKCTGSCNVLSPKICVPKETKDIHVNAFNMITNKMKLMKENISCDCKCKFNSTTCNSNQKWNNKICQCECKNYHKCEKDYSWNPSTYICENTKFLKSVTDFSVTKCVKIVIAMVITSTKKTNTIATSVTSTALINLHSKKVRDCYILHTVLLVVIKIKSENSKFLKSVADFSVTKCDKIVVVMVIASTKNTNTIATIVTSTALINCHRRKVRDFYILHTVLLVIILLLIITIVCYQNKKVYKAKKYNIKWKILNLKKFILKIVHVIISMI